MNDEKVFRPKFYLTSEIENAIEEIERNAWLVDNLLIMPKHASWIRRNVTAERVAGTVQIEGGDLDEGDVKELMSKPPKTRMGEFERANRNALRAYEFVDYLSDQPDLPIDEATVRQINREFMYGFEDKTPGVYRTGEIDIYGFTPPNQGDVPNYIRKFALWLREDNDLNPIIKASIAHIHLVAIHPFWDGNGRTARALATLILQRSDDHSFQKLLSLERHIYNIRDDYLSAIERTLGDRFSEEYDATRWLDFFVSQLNIHARILTGTLTEWHRGMEEVYAVADDAGLNHRQADGIAFALRTGRLTRPDYIEITGVSASTASRDLAFMAEKGFLEAEGQTRARVYYPVGRDEDKDDETGKQQSLFEDVPKWRRRKGQDTWHFCRNCSTWPTSNYDVRYSKPSSGEFCNECIAKQDDGNCK